MQLKMTVDNIKLIKHLSIALPLDRGLYAITGENATGKSTLVTCAASAFYHFDASQYFGKLTDNSSISFECGLDNQTFQYDHLGNTKVSGNIGIKGFYEGSLIYGNRFRNTTYGAIKKLDSIVDDDIEPANNFIRENLGIVLQNDKSCYQDLYRLKPGLQNKYKLGGTPFFYKRDGNRVNQSHMSTGENLMLSILHSLNLRISDRDDISIPCLIFLDEIELALHASSLRRLVSLLKNIAAKYNIAIYFSTHSIELIRDINPNNIFYLQKFLDGSLDIINPCYPAYATKNLYDSNMGYDDVILVEDDLARTLLHRILVDNALLNSKLICILPCGGWQNVLRFSQDILQSNLLGPQSKIMIVLDADITDFVIPFVNDNNMNINSPLNFLPVPSLEKYLKTNLYDAPNHLLTKSLDDYIFQKVGLRTILQNYKNMGPYKKNDNNGKELFKALEIQFISNGKTRSDLIERVVSFIEEFDKHRLIKIVNFLKKNL